LKTETVSDLKQAYNLFIEHRDSNNPLYALFLLEEACNLLDEVAKTLSEGIENFTLPELVEIVRLAKSVKIMPLK
jgi:hypothetical protein